MTVKGNPQRIFCEGVRWGDLDNAEFEDIVGFFQRKIEYSFFIPIKDYLLPQYKTTGIMILTAVSAVIDLVSQYYYSGDALKHKDKYKRFLREHFPGFSDPVRIKKFPHVKDYADFFYEGFRCQLLHNFMLSEHSTIGWKTGTVFLHMWNPDNGAKEIIVNPRELLARLEAVFGDYITKLLDKHNIELRRNFANKLFIDTGVKVDCRGSIFQPTSVG